MRLVGALVGGVAGSGGVALLVSDVLEESCLSLLSWPVLYFFQFSISLPPV